MTNMYSLGVLYISYNLFGYMCTHTFACINKSYPVGVKDHLSLCFLATIVYIVIFPCLS